MFLTRRHFLFSYHNYYEWLWHYFAIQSSSFWFLWLRFWEWRLSRTLWTRFCIRRWITPSTLSESHVTYSRSLLSKQCSTRHVDKGVCTMWNQQRNGLICSSISLLAIITSWKTLILLRWMSQAKSNQWIQMAEHEEEGKRGWFTYWTCHLGRNDGIFLLR